MVAHGFSAQQLAALFSAGLATATAERMFAGQAADGGHAREDHGGRGGGSWAS